MAKNPKIKRPFTQTTYTVKQVEELKKCITDPVYFINNYVYILHPKKGKVKFKLYDYQEKLIRSYQQNRFNIVKASRQVGKTETSTAYLLWFALFHGDKTILVAANKLTNAKEVINRAQGIYEELPDWLKPGIDESEWNKTSLSFENGSKIIAQATSASTGRGFAISLLYLDELAFVPPHVQAEMWTSIFPVLSAGGSCIISSTPNGSTDLYHDLFIEAEAKKNSFVAINVAWDEPPGRDEKFKESVIQDIGLQRWKQEYLAEFLTSEKTLLDYDMLNHAEKMLPSNPVMKVGSLFGQEFWKTPSRDSTYIVGVDPAQGVGNDFSVIEVFEFPSMEQVAEYRSNTQSPAELYSYLKTLLRFLERNSRDVFYSVENNAIGQAVIALYEADINPLEKAIFMSEDGKDTLGYNSNNSTKNKALVAFKELFERGHLKINSKHLIRECKTLVRKDNTFKAQLGANNTDDCVFATLICIRIVEDMAQFDRRAYEKMYSFQHVKEDSNWEYQAPTPTETSDDGFMPFIMG